MKKLLVILVIIALLGGGAYYEFVYAPPVYSKAVLGVIKEFETTSSEIPQPESVSDPLEKIIAIKRQSEFLTQAREKISALNPPFFGELRQFHNDILGMIGLSLAAYNKQEEQIAFFGGILELEDVLEPEYIDQGTATMGDIQKHFEAAVPKVRTRIDEILSKEPSFEFKNVTFSEIKSAWQEARPEFDVWLSFISELNSAQPLSGGSGIPPPSQKAEEAVRSIITFLDLVKKAAASNVDTSQLMPPVDEESSAREQRINDVIDKLREKYPE